MAFDILSLLDAHRGRNYELHEAHVNARFARALKIIGFDRCYVKAKGAYLWDQDGRKFLDTLAGYGTFNVGRNHPTVRQALIDVMANDCASLVKMEAPLASGLLAGELKKRVGYDLDTVHFPSTGSEGNETAIKFVRRATGKPRIVYAASAFHGLTTGALSLNSGEEFREGFGALLPDTEPVPFGDADALEQVLRKGDVAALVIEPIQGKGVKLPPAGYLAEAGRLCRKFGALFVADEVQTGIGRTGRFLALHHEAGVDPDVVVLAKSLSGGYVPVGAVLAKRWIYDKVFPSLDRCKTHGSTFGQGTLAMVAGLATLHVLDEEKLIENAARMGDLLGQRLTQLKGRYEFLHDVRWRGLMIGIEFGKPKSLALRTAWNGVMSLNKDLFCQGVTIPLLADHGILTQVAANKSTVIKLIPPLVITEADVDWFMAGFEKVMDDLHRFPGPLWEGLFRIAKNAVTAASPRHAAAF